jgi:hypothetical protein
MTLSQKAYFSYFFFFATFCINNRAKILTKIKKFFPQVFKMAENWYFDQNTMSFELICGLFYDLSSNHKTKRKTVQNSLSHGQKPNF